MYGILLKFNVVSGSRTTVKWRLVLHGCGFEFGFCHCINLHWAVCALRCVKCAYSFLLLFYAWCEFVVCSSFFFLQTYLPPFLIFSHFIFFSLNIQAKSFGPCNLHHQTYFPLDRINFHTYFMYNCYDFRSPGNVYNIVIEYCRISDDFCYWRVREMRTYGHGDIQVQQKPIKWC